MSSRVVLVDEDARFRTTTRRPPAADGGEVGAAVAAGVDAVEAVGTVEGVVVGHRPEDELLRPAILELPAAS
jgi:hypothetical protein